MCGITGWVDYQADLRGEEQTLRDMTRTMSCRGPDASGVWLRREVAFGHRRLAVIDVEGGGQPMLAPAGDGVVAITYSGEVYNFRELRRELQELGYRFRTRSDTEVVLAAYLEWGRDFVERLNGMFAFGLWDERSRKLLLVRDRLGIKPLFYAPMPDGVLFGSEPKAILAHPRFEAAVDEDGLRQLMGVVSSPGMSIWHGMHEVRPGTVVVVDQNGRHTHTYWKLEARPHQDDVETTVGKVRELLDDIVGRQLISDVPLCTLLSGGLDSSALTALAAEQLRRQGGGPVRSFAVDFAGHSERFHPDQMRDTPDGPYVKALAAHVESDHTDVVLDSDQLMDAGTRAAVVRAYDSAPFMGDLNTSLYLLFKAIREHSTVALSGESADEVFGGYAWFHDPDAVAADTFPWMSMVRRPAAGRNGLLGSILRPELDRGLSLDDYLKEAYREAVAEVPHLEGEDARESRMREVCHMHLTRFLPRLLDRKDRMSMAVGLEVRVPFCDHRLVEYVFNTPWAMKTFDGREKSLLRAATADVLPCSIVERRKSPYPSTQDPAYASMIIGELRSIADEPRSPVLDLVDRSSLAGLGQVLEGGAMEDQFVRLGAEMVLALDGWLSEYRPRLLL
jgi:asparagine synthase (glutamine-hydrolysing)